MIRVFYGNHPCVTSDGKKIIYSFARSALKVLDLDSGTELFTLSSHSGFITATCISFDGKFVVSGSNDKTIIPNKNQLLTGSSSHNKGGIEVFDLMTKEKLFAFKAHAGIVDSITVTADEKKIISTGPDYMVKVWDLDVLSNQEFSNIEHNQQVETLAIIPNTNFVVSGSDDTSIKIWDYKTGEERTYRPPIMYQEYDNGVLGSTQLEQLEMNNWILSSAVTCDGKIISGLFSGKIRISNLLTFQSPEKTKIKVTPITISPDTPYERKVLEAQVELENEFLLSGHTDGVFSIAVTSDGQKAISGSRDGTAIIWDLTTQSKLSTLDHYGQIYAVKVTSDDQWLILGSGKNIEIFNLETTVPKLTLKGHNSSVISIAITPDEKQIISGSTDGTIKVWDLATGKEQFSFLTGHQDMLRTIDIIPDGKTLISGSWDHTIKVWDLISRKEITTLTVDGMISSCIVAPDETIIAGDSTGKVHFLRLEGMD